MELSPPILLRPAGAASRLTLPGVDNPQALADEIMSCTQHGTSSL
ncbi:MAG: hypothetical protein ACLQU1_12065 [Bryobacteraceae bacterium]